MGPVAMSLKTLLLLVVVAISLHTATSSPTISFEAIGKEKDNVVKSLVGLKGAIISPFAGIAKAKLGLVGGLAGAKLGLAKGLLAPKIAIASGLVELRRASPRDSLGPSWVLPGVSCDL